MPREFWEFVANRDLVSDGCLLALTASDVARLYEAFVAPAVDGLEAVLVSGVDR